MQTSIPANAGFVQRDKYEVKKKHRQLNQVGGIAASRPVDQAAGAAASNLAANAEAAAHAHERLLLREACARWRLQLFSAFHRAPLPTWPHASLAPAHQLMHPPFPATLPQVLCERCSELCNGAMVPAVEDFTQKQQIKLLLEQRQQQEQHERQATGGALAVAAAPAAAVAAGAGPLERAELFGKLLVSPEELRTQLLVRMRAVL